MRDNPYTAPAQDCSVAGERKRTVSASAFRIGVAIAALGVVAFICCWVTFEMVFDGPAPFWLQLILLVSLAAVPLGAIVAFVGGAIWIFRRLGGKPLPNS